MNKYYHFTSMNNLDGILAEGLKPLNGLRSKSIQDEETAVFLTKGINNSIQMYSHMINFFLRYLGEEGDKVLNDCYMDLQNINPYWPDYYKKAVKKECYSTIQRIFEIRSYQNFYNYLNGLPCLLSVNGIVVDDEIQPDNCSYNNIIPPTNINFVYLRNKNTNEINFNLEAIYYYYKKTNPYISFSNDSIEDVNKFFGYINDGYCNMNTNDFELIEEPILNYVQRINNEKTLTLR